MERRLRIVVVVRLARAEGMGVDGEERTYTDNISSRGARVYSIRPWQLGDAVQVTPRNDGPASGNVVYCQTLEDGRFVIGVKFQERTIAWSAENGSLVSKVLAKRYLGSIPDLGQKR